MTVRIGIVDDHTIIRIALLEIFADEDDFEVVGEASSGREAIELARNSRLDVMLLDIEMPGQSGLDALPHIVSKDPAPAVLVLSSHPPATYGIAMVKKGASGYLNKQAEPEEIVAAVRCVARGQKYLNPELASKLVERDTEKAKAPHEHLTERQFQVFLRLAKGQLNPQIGNELNLSGQTVATYRTVVVSKLDVRTNSELTYYAIKHDLIG